LQYCICRLGAGWLWITARFGLILGDFPTVKSNDTLIRLKNIIVASWAKGFGQQKKVLANAV